jgi:hypothetical protein
MKSRYLKCSDGSLAHPDAVEMVGTVAGGRTATPWSTTTNSLAEKMKPMPPIHIIPERLLG